MIDLADNQRNIHPLQYWNWTKSYWGTILTLRVLYLIRFALWTITSSCDGWVSAGRRFSVRSYCGREERQVTLRFPSASVPVSLHKFPRSSKIWVSRSCRRLHTCLFTPSGPQFWLARKTASPAGEAQLSFTKGKRIRTQTFQELWEWKEWQ